MGHKKKKRISVEYETAYTNGWMGAKFGVVDHWTKEN